MGCGADRPESAPEDAVFGVVLEQCRALTSARGTAVAVGTYAAVTVAHSFEDVASFELVDRHGVVWPADVVLVDPAVDLAVLQLRAPHPAPLELVDIELGTDGRMISFADAAGQRIEPVEIRRRVNATLDGADPRRALEVGVSARRGDSGAPVLDALDRVGGIHFASSRRAERGWAIDVSEVRAVLERADASAGSVELGCG
ncbi:MAG: trypsin-like peptidase domain-containing protein [Actinomycetota bacterium]